jgi:hypothetical protein
MVRRTAEEVGELSWELVDGPDVPGRLQADIDQALGAGHEVSLKAMQVILDDATRPIINMLIEAAREDPDQAARIDFQADSFALRYGQKPEHRAQIPELAEKVETLRALGASALFTNPYLSTPLGSPHGKFLKETLRDHRKGHTAGDVLWLGPSNFHQENFDGSQMADFMLRTENGAAANLVRRIFRQDAYRRMPDHNENIKLNDSNHLLLDGGIPMSSFILRAVHQLTDDMVASDEPVLFTSQYYPTLKIARAIHNSPSALAAFNNSSALDGEGMGLAARLQQLIEQLGPGIPDATAGRYVHAKSYSAVVRPNNGRDLFPNHDGRIGVLGTHNMNQLGVWAGTQELAVATIDPSVLDQHTRWMEKKFYQS